MRLIQTTLTQPDNQSCLDRLSGGGVPHAVQHGGGGIMLLSCRRLKSSAANLASGGLSSTHHMLKSRNVEVKVHAQRQWHRSEEWAAIPEETCGSLIKSYANGLLSALSQKGEANNISCWFQHQENVPIRRFTADSVVSAERFILSTPQQPQNKARAHLAGVYTLLV